MIPKEKKQTKQTNEFIQGWEEEVFPSRVEQAPDYPIGRIPEQVSFTRNIQFLRALGYPLPAPVI